MPWRAIFPTLLPVRANRLTQVPISPSVYFERSPKLCALQCGVNGPGLFSSHCCTHKHIQQNSLWSSADWQHQLRLLRSRSVGGTYSSREVKQDFCIDFCQTEHFYGVLKFLTLISLHSQTIQLQVILSWRVWRMKMLGYARVHVLWSVYLWCVGMCNCPDRPCINGSWVESHSRG